MKSTPRTFGHLPGTGGFVAPLLMAVLLLLPFAASAQESISDGCEQCHNEIFNEWKASGHPYKLMPGVQAKNRAIPLPDGYSWDEISYVIGGYKWKSRYMDQDGYIITQGLTGDNAFVNKTEPGDTQWNYLVGEWSNYHSDEEDGTKPYDCGSCHTTNWVANENPEDTTGNQGGLPGIHGTFDEGGIHCVQCHGGSQHADFDNIDRSADACGACHYRTASPDDEVNLIPASGGWIKHHEQYNEHLAGPHGSRDCVMCHNPHSRGEFSIWEEGAEGHENGAQCGINCHSSKMESFMETSMFDYGVTCEDCHMPFATKSALAQGPNMGDVMTHIYYINTDPVNRDAMFNAEGTEVLLDNEGKAAVTLDFVCQRCHETASLDELSKFAMGFHTEGAAFQNVGINTGLTGTWWDSTRSGEGFLLEVTMLNGAPFVFLSFYTYDDQGNQVYLVATSNAINGTTAEIDVFITSGQFWGAGWTPDFVAESAWGAGTVEFSTCGDAEVSLRPNNDAQASGFTNYTFTLTRFFENIACPAFDNTSGVAAN